MSGVVIRWSKAQRVTLGIPSRLLPGIMDEWAYREAPITMTVRRAKTKGLTLLIMDLDKDNAQGAMFACWCIKQANGEAKVDIKAL